VTTDTLARPAVAVAAQPAPHVRIGLRLGRLALLLNALLVYAFLYVPVLILIVFSFNSTRSLAVFTSFSTEWYVQLLNNEELLAAARNSLIVGVIATLASTVIGTMTALAMDRHRFRLRTAFDANLYLPVVIPEIVMGISLLLFFNQALFPFLQAVTGLRASTGLHTITIAHIAFDIPFVYIIVRARLADFDRRLEEAAQDLGADEWRTFRRVTMPLLMPGIIGGALMAFTLSLDDYLITVFTKGVRDQTMPLYIYSLVRKGVTPEINALSTALLVGSMGLVGLSLTAQGGGPLFTRGMSLGALAGASLNSLVRMAALAGAGSLGLGAVLRLLPLALLFWAARSGPAWWHDLKGANLSGRLLALFSVLVAGGAAFISMALLFP
jgi:spermidine/putrescine transport system permease protein